MAEGTLSRVMVVEDDEGHVALIRRALRDEPYDVRYGSTLAEARAALPDMDLVIIDWRLPDGRGTDLLAEDGRPSPVVVMTSHGDEHVAVDAMKAGALDYVVKSDALLTEFDRVVERSLRAWRNIAQRQEAERALTASEARWRSMVESSPDVILLTDAEGRIVFFNRLLPGLDDPTGRELTDIFGSSLREPLQDARRVAVEGERPRSLSVELEHAGETLHYELRVGAVAAPEGAPSMVLSLSDVTSRRRAERERAALEQQLQQAQRLETIGTLAGGVAHDFNNILQAILGFSQLALGTLADASAGESPHPAVRDLQSVMDAAQRGRDLVKQILAFSRHQPQEPRPVRAAELVEEALNLVRVSMPKTVELSVDNQAPDLRLHADATQIHQVIVNLATNAIQAMDGAGQLRLTLDVGPVPDAVRRAHPDLVAGAFGRIQLVDTGEGMDEATQRRIFEPFFTTKPVGAGTGLGLAVVHGIVRGHRGAIGVESTLGRGTAVTVYLPTLGAAVAPAPSAPELERGAGQHVMFVDDEPMVARVASEMLGRFGYRVTTFQRPDVALERFTEDPHHFDAVVTDLTMPEMSGTALAAEIYALRSDIPILLTTGYASHTEAGGPGVRRTLVKPYDIQELSSALREVLDGETI